jgi:tannase/feruloyl esterase
MRFGGLLLLATMTSSQLTADGAARCEALTGLHLPNTTITLAQSVAAGAFVSPKPFSGPGDAPPPPPFTQLPAFCRVAATVRPTNGSNIKFEVWLPSGGWNGKLAGVGNGAYAGDIRYYWMSEPLSRGYATANTDTGHEGPSTDPKFALEDPEHLIDFGYRAVHEMTAKAKDIVAAFYGRRPQLSYWTGCSTGGRQALMEAQRFPDDYDGIIAGAPSNNTTHSQAQQVWIAQALARDGAASFLPPNKLALLHATVIEACDALDGVHDGVLEDPRRCRFDPSILLCQGDDGPRCLTAAQVKSAQQVYSDVENPRTKQTIFPRLVPGGELLWSLGVGPVRQNPLFVGPIFKYVTFRNQPWDYRTFDFDRDVQLTDRVARPVLDAIDPNIRPFLARGGKLLHYHGWSDPGISPLNSLDYYEQVRDTVGVANVNDGYRLFMVPGMGHCRDGEGTEEFDMLTALEEWREKGMTPARIPARKITNGQVERTRPLCPYPQVATYVGTGDTNDAANFVCKLP